MSCEEENGEGRHIRVAGERWIRHEFGMPQEPNIRSGFRFKEGKLMIFREEGIMVIRGWPVPDAVRKERGETWASFEPKFRLVRPYRRSRKRETREKPGEQLSFDFGGLEEGVSLPHRKRLTKPQQRKRAFDSFRFSLPKEVARALDPFRSHQWPLLKLLAHDERALDLAKGNPALAYVLAQMLRGNAERIRAGGFGSMKQREILRRIGLPDTNGVVKVFRKIAPESLDGDTWRPLFCALALPEGRFQKTLVHLPRINSGVLRIMLDPELESCVTPRLLVEVAEDKRERYRAGIAELIVETLTMQDELDIRGRDRVRKFASLEKLRAAHDRAMQVYARLQEYGAMHGGFPPPPLPGIEGRIVPLRVPKQLLEEGREQHNCVGSYAKSVAEGGTFIYRVLYPERATLSIVRGPSGDWEIGELQARFNEGVKAGTRRFVGDWLAGYAVGI